MKQILNSATVLVLFSLACNFPSILSDEKKEEETPLDNAEQSGILLNVDITGGFAGVQQNLQIDQAGNAHFTDTDSPGAVLTSQLTESELGNLKKLMGENNFFQLSDSYIDSRVADAFIYTISYHESDKSKTVQTDGISAPENLKTIVEGILVVKSRITENGLRLELQVSKSQIKPGEAVELTLLVTNVTDSPLTLTFHSGQIFDFEVAKIPPPGSLAPEILIWNWAHNKAFTLQIWTLVVQPGETKSYQVTWDGKDNNGNTVQDKFAIRASLLSVPGGSPEEKSIVVEN